MTAVLAPPDRASGIGISGLNDNGDVVGTASFSDSFAHAVLWEAGGEPLLLDESDEHTWGIDINNAGQVAGQRGDVEVSHAVVFKDGEIRDLHSLFGTSSSSALAINEEGVVAGGAGDNAYYPHPVLCDSQSGEVTSFNPLPGTAWAHANAINGAGHAAGVSYNQAAVSPFIFLYSNGQVVGHGLGEASALNDNDTVVGARQFPAASAETAFRLKPGAGFENLGHSTLPGYGRSMALDVNNADVVVGSSLPADPQDTSVAPRAFVASPEIGLRDLANVTIDAEDWEFNYATGINASGQIAGSGLLNGEKRGFLLSPVPDIPDVDVLSDRYAITLIEMFGGAAFGGAGTGILPGGKPIPIDPHGPQQLPEERRDLLVGLAIREIAGLLGDRASRDAVEKVAAAVVDAAIEKLQRNG